MNNENQNTENTDTAVEAPQLNQLSSDDISRVAELVVHSDLGLTEALASIEKQSIQLALQAHGGNRSAAARMLKLPRQTFQDRIKKHIIGPVA